jgi:hypothetical protein
MRQDRPLLPGAGNLQLSESNWEEKPYKRKNQRMLFPIYAFLGVGRRKK